MRTYGDPTFRIHDSYSDLAFSVDGRSVLALSSRSDGDEALLAIDAATGAVVAGPKAQTYAVLADGVVSAKGSTVTFSRADDLTLTRTVEVPAPVGRLAAGAGLVVALVAEPPSIVLVDAAVREVPLPAPPTCAAVSEDGAFVAVGTGSGRTGSVLVVDVATGLVASTLKGPRAPVTSIVVSGKDVVAASAGPRVLAWTLTGVNAPTALTGVNGQKALTGGKAPKAVTLLAGKQPARVVGVTADGLVLAEESTEALHAVDPATGVVAWTTEQYFTAAAVHGNHLASVHFNDVRELDPVTGKILRTWTAPGFAHGCDVHDDVIAATSGFGRVVLIGADTPSGGWPAAADRGHESRILAASFDGERFATSGHDERVCVWERGNATPLCTVEEFDALWAGKAVHLDGDTLWTTFSSQVQRRSIAAGTSVTSDSLKDEVTALVPVPGTGFVVAACEAHRSTYGALNLLDERTLTSAFTMRLNRTYTKADVIGAGLVLLHDGRNRLVFDVASRTVVEDRCVHPGSLSLKAHSPVDGSLLVEVDHGVAGGKAPRPGSVTVIEAGTGARQTWTTEVIRRDSALSTTGVLATLHEHAVRFWDIATATQIATAAVPPLARRLWFFPDGRAVLVTCDNGAMVEIEF